MTESVLSRSRVTGTSTSVSVYLDAESARNVFKDNLIDAETQREQMAIDGSETAPSLERRCVFDQIRQMGITALSPPRESRRSAEESSAD